MYWDPINDCMVSRKKGPKTFNKQEMLEKGYQFRGRFAKHRFVYPRLNRKNIVITPKEKEPDYIQSSLIFTNDGKIIK
jgi:hypothetical protein